jgi:hypothetical protein
MIQTGGTGNEQVSHACSLAACALYRQARGEHNPFIPYEIPASYSKTMAWPSDESRAKRTVVKIFLTKSEKDLQKGAARVVGAEFRVIVRHQSIQTKNLDKSSHGQYVCSGMGRVRGPDLQRHTEGAMRPLVPFQEGASRFMAVSHCWSMVANGRWVQ